jgi:ATP-grasp domain
MAIFVQIGATRDGSDPYLRVAHDRAMEAVLVETPDYIRLRQQLGRQEFDQTLTVEQPSDVHQVTNALRRLPESPALILAGFERYIYSAYAAARLWKTPPYFRGDTFTPLNKAEQRTAISRSAASILQPKYLVLTHRDVSPHDLENFHYPLVVKPVDGGGGLGVFLASNFEGIHAALRALESITNYDGGAFQGISIEEYLPGDEYSVQGLVQEGHCIILTFCKKFVTIEPIAGTQFLYGFREVGHIATRGDHVNPTMKHFAQTCVDVFKYYNGPFHIDMVQSSRGYYHLEMGFRLSGFGLVRLVQRVSGHDWAEEAFASHLVSVPSSGSRKDIDSHRLPTGKGYTPNPNESSGNTLGKSSLRPTLTSESPYMGQFTAISQTEIDNARQLQRQGYPIEVQLFNNPDLRITSSRLKSDLTRHAGTLGRITAHAPTFREVERLLQKCSHKRNRTKESYETISSAFSPTDLIVKRFI